MVENFVVSHKGLLKSRKLFCALYLKKVSFFVQNRENFNVSRGTFRVPTAKFVTIFNNVDNFQINCTKIFRWITVVQVAQFSGSRFQNLCAYCLLTKFQECGIIVFSGLSWMPAPRSAICTKVFNKIMQDAQFQKSSQNVENFCASCTICYHIQKFSTKLCKMPNSKNHLKMLKTFVQNAELFNLHKSFSTFCATCTIPKIISKC